MSRLNFVSRMAAGASALVLIIMIGILLTRSATWTSTEMRVLAAIGQTHTAILDAVALGINFLLSPVMAAIVLLVASLIVFSVARTASITVQFFVVVAGSWLGSEVVKNVVSRPRPDHLLLAHASIIEHASS